MQYFVFMYNCSVGACSIVSLCIIEASSRHYRQLMVSLCIKHCFFCFKLWEATHCQKFSMLAPLCYVLYILWRYRKRVYLGAVRVIRTCNGVANWRAGTAHTVLCVRKGRRRMIRRRKKSRRRRSRKRTRRRRRKSRRRRRRRRSRGRRK